MPTHAQRMSSLLAADREYAYCRVARRACGLQGETRESRRLPRWCAGREIAVQAACAGERAATTDLGGGGGEEHTENMLPMSVTREVSQLSGWLKAVAPCRGAQAQGTLCGAGCGPGGGTRRAAAVRAQHVQGGGRV